MIWRTKFYFLLRNLLWLVIGVGGIILCIHCSGCSIPQSQAQQKLAADLRAALTDGVISPEEAALLARDMNEIAGGSGIPQWLTIAGSVVGALGASFLGIRAGKNGLQAAIAGAQQLATAAHERIDSLTPKG